jgi:hypothetical protein
VDERKEQNRIIKVVSELVILPACGEFSEGKICNRELMIRTTFPGKKNEV